MMSRSDARHSAPATNPLSPTSHLVVQCDSNSSLEELFSVVKQPSDPNLHRAPYADKKGKLPRSFFEEPLGGRRSGTRSPCNSGHQSPKRLATGLQVHHGRSISSPANLHQSLSAVKTTPQHSKQGSYDGYLDVQDSQMAQHPGGWTPDMVAAAAAAAAAAGNKSIGYNYPADLASRTMLQQQQQATDLGPMPYGWEQSVTPEGEVYYIDHNNKTTSWTDPRLTKRTQVVNQQQCQQPTMVAGVGCGLSDGRRLSNEQLIEVELQKLQQEKQRIKREQESILQKERLLAEMMSRSAISSPPVDLLVGPNGLSPAAGGVMTHPGCSSGGGGNIVDPFLVQNASCISHARQSSGDSGLGGMGTAYSLPRTPDDFLGHVDENMDVQDGHQRSGLMSAMNSYAAANMHGGGGQMRMDLNMDPGQLMEGDISEFSPELLAGIESSEGMLTWL